MMIFQCCGSSRQQQLVSTFFCLNVHEPLGYDPQEHTNMYCIQTFVINNNTKQHMTKV